MPNETFRSRLVSQISSGISLSDDAVRANHPGLAGRIRELAAKYIISPFLPEDFQIARSGKIIDCLGNESRELDLIIYSKKKLPPVVFESEPLFIPSEAAYYAIEIKSKLTATTVKDAIEKAIQLHQNIKYGPGVFTDDDKGVKQVISPVLSSLFGFSSDLVGSGKTELDRFKELVGDPSKFGCMTSICSVGKGTWRWVHRKNSWVFYPPTENYYEVIDYLAGISNTLHKIDQGRGFPRLGTYLMSPERGIEVS